MTNPNPSIAIWEDDYCGHTLAFVEILIRQIYDKTKVPVLFFSTKAAFQSDAYLVYLRPLEGKFIPRVVGNNFSGGKPLVLWGQFKQIEKELNEKGITRLIVSTADSVVKTLGLAHLLGWRPKKLEIRCCLLYLGIAYPGRNILTRFKDRFAFWLKNWTPVHGVYIDQWAVERVKEKYGISLPICPEPLYSLGEYLQERTVKPHTKSSSGVCFGFPGGARFGDRKGPELLIDAFLQADLPLEARLVFAGYFFDPAILKKFKQASEILGDRFQVFNGYLKTKELFSVVDQMDVVCLPYRSHVGTSAFFAQSATMGKVILASNYGWLGGIGSKYNKAVFFENNSIPSLAAALEKINKDFSILDSLSSNYSPISEDEFVKVLAGI